MKKRARVDIKSSGSAIFPFCYLLLLISSVYLNTRQAQERIFNPLVQVKELPLLNRNKKELITTACEQLSSTEGAPIVTRSLISLKSSFDLELTYNIGRKRDIQKTWFPVLRTWLKREKKTGLISEDLIRRLNLTFISRLELDLNVFGSCLGPAFTPLSLSYQERRLALAISNWTFRNPCSWLIFT